jgi:hypothetical protein
LPRRVDIERVVGENQRAGPFHNRYIRWEHSRRSFSVKKSCT